VSGGYEAAVLGRQDCAAELSSGVEEWFERVDVKVALLVVEEVGSFLNGRGAKGHESARRRWHAQIQSPLQIAAD